MSVIVLNSVDKPFGKLANDAILPFKVDSRVYSSIVNYVYSNLLPESTFKEELCQTVPKDVLSTFVEVKKHLKRSTIQFAVQVAISEKVKRDRKFAEKLIDTGNRKIVYYSANNFLGNGKAKNGENIYGQVLEQVRNELLTEQDRNKKKDDIYLSYIAEINLKKALKRHNLEKYISKDKKRSIKRLVESLVQDYGRTEVYSNAPDLETILTLHEKRNIMTYTDPNSLIRVVRKNEIRNILKRNSLDLKVAALRSFVDYTLSQNVTASEDNTALKDQLFNILPSKREEFSNRILDLYSVKALPDEVKEKIKQFKSQWYFPSEKDIEFFETENIKIPQPSAPIVEDSNEIFKVYFENDVLSPLNDTILVIDNLKFKSISQYIAFELSKLYGTMDNTKLYTRIQTVKLEDLDTFNKMLEKDFFDTTKNRLLENAINIKLQQYHIKHLVFSIKQLEIKDSFNLERTEEFYNMYKDKILLKIQKIPSFEQFVEKEPFLVEIINEKIDFYFMILDNLMVHAKSKNRLNVTFDNLVEMSPFYSSIMLNDSNVPKTRIPDYLMKKKKNYGLSNQSTLQIWSIVYNGMKQSEKIVGENEYDIRYKCLLIWAQYFLGESVDLKTMKLMQSSQEDIVLTVLISILSKLKEVNLRFNSPVINFHDLQTAVNLCLGRVRIYKAEFELVEQDLDFEEREFEEDVVENDQLPEVYDEEVYDEEVYEENYGEEEFEGFNLSSKRKFEAFLVEYFKPLRTKLDLSRLEEAVYKIINSNVPQSTKNQNLNFFMGGFKAPQL
jgi:predicted NAD-dependent protein-ADP-ribosyltransferase YbiA (DUF1768 family)